MLDHFWAFQCHGVVCNGFSVSEWVVIDCLETQLHGLASLDCREFANVCQHRTIGDGKHLVFECPALQDLRNKRPHLFEGAQADAMVLFMWQDDMIGVVRFIDDCLERNSTHLISPEMAGKDVMSISLSLSLLRSMNDSCHT